MTRKTNSKLLGMLIVSTLLSGCAANNLDNGANNVRLVTKTLDKIKTCEYLGEIIGSQGNWVTGDYTSNENLILGARNDLRNKAYKLGANTVYVENMANTNAWGSLGTTNSTVIGQAYKCNQD